MTDRNLLQRLLDSAPDDAEATWAKTEERVNQRRRPWRLLVVAAAAGALALAVALGWSPRPRPNAPRESSNELYLYVARSDRPVTEALELTVRNSP